MVIGGGTIGLLSAWLARSLGAAQTVVVARHPHQRAAERLGAQVASEPAEAQELVPGGADVVVETVGGKSRTLVDATALARPGATLGMLGVFTGGTPIPGLDFSVKELTLVGSNCYGMGPRPQRLRDCCRPAGPRLGRTRPRSSRTPSHSRM